jgi:hypothetical protein
MSVPISHLVNSGVGQVSGQVGGQVSGQVDGQVCGQVWGLLEDHVGAPRCSNQGARQTEKRWTRVKQNATAK